MQFRIMYPSNARNKSSLVRNQADLVGKLIDNGELIRAKWLLCVCSIPLLLLPEFIGLYD